MLSGNIGPTYVDRRNCRAGARLSAVLGLQLLRAGRSFTVLASRAVLICVLWSWTWTALAASDLPRGEFGGDINQLRRCYVAPELPEEGNCYFELWEGQRTRPAVLASGLLDARTLFINSHGKAIRSAGKTRFALYPHETLAKAGRKASYYSARDLAMVIGPERAAQIHNILIAACNAEGAFDAAELRRHFVNATNITHAAAGELGYQPMFLQTFLAESDNIRPLYEVAHRGAMGAREYLITAQPRERATRFAPYIAELFEPGAKRPFRRQIAGRELLDPSGATWLAARERALLQVSAR